MELDTSGFATQGPTVFAGNIGENRYIVQVSPLGIRLLEGGGHCGWAEPPRLFLPTPSGWPACSGHHTGTEQLGPSAVAGAGGTGACWGPPWPPILIWEQGHLGLFPKGGCRAGGTHCSDLKGVLGWRAGAGPCGPGHGRGSAG